nr:hypothetical protein [Pedobacter sp. ASV19]
MKRTFIVAVYKLYSWLNGGEIGRYFKEVKTVHDHTRSIEDAEIRKYLSESGFEGELKLAPLMIKKDISARLKTTDKSRIHSFAFTGGSYGEPFKVPYSKARTLVRTASFKYFNEIAGYRLGDPFLLIAAKEKPHWKQFLRNEYRFVPKRLTEEKIKGVADLLIAKGIKVIIGFPSVVYELALFIDKHPVKHQVKAIIFTSEPIIEEKSAFIRKVFNCRVTDRYSNEEVGLIAQQREFGGTYFTNRYNVLVEILDEQLNPVKEGETGRVVVTDLKADILPIVRYDTGDLAVAHRYENGQLLELRSISGRVTEQIYTTEGHVIAPLALGPLIHMPLTKSGYYNQFQFAQVGQRHYELRIKTEQGLPDEIVGKIEQNLRVILGADAQLICKFLKDIRPQSSGKRPIYKNEWLNRKER